MGGGDNLDALALDDLIAYAPAEYRGMIAVAQHHRFNVLVPPLVDVARIVVGGFAVAPSVKRFVDYDQSLSVALVKECRRRRVVACAHGIESCLLHQRHLAGFGGIVAACSEHSVVMMGASAVEHYRLAVEG